MKKWKKKKMTKKRSHRTKCWMPRNSGFCVMSAEMALAPVALDALQRDAIINLIYHPLKKFQTRKPLPSLLHKTYGELFLGRSWIDILQELHQKYVMSSWKDSDI